MSEWKWFVTVKAIRDAAYVLGYDPNVEEGSDDWDYLESLLGGLSLIARKKRDLDKPGLESWAVGKPHLNIQLKVSQAKHSGGPLPQLVAVDPPHSRWRRPKKPIALKIPS